MGINYNKEYIYIRDFIYKYIFIWLYIIVYFFFLLFDVKILENFFKIMLEYCKGKYGYKNVNNEKR